MTAKLPDSPQAAAAMDKICRTYWPPLFAFIRRTGCDVAEAEDLTQVSAQARVGECRWIRIGRALGWACHKLLAMAPGRALCRFRAPGTACRPAPVVCDGSGFPEWGWHATQMTRYGYGSVLTEPYPFVEELEGELCGP